MEWHLHIKFTRLCCLALKRRIDLCGTFEVHLRAPIFISLCQYTWAKSISNMFSNRNLETKLQADERRNEPCQEDMWQDFSGRLNMFCSVRLSCTFCFVIKQKSCDLRLSLCRMKSWHQWQESRCQFAFWEKGMNDWKETFHTTKVHFLKKKYHFVKSKTGFCFHQAWFTIASNFHSGFSVQDIVAVHCGYLSIFSVFAPVLDNLFAQVFCCQILFFWEQKIWRTTSLT